MLLDHTNRRLAALLALSTGGGGNSTTPNSRWSFAYP